jgi:molybdopterin converting factor small subunit
MNIRVLFFGATADETGKRSMEFTVKVDAGVRSAFGEILSEFPQLQKHKLLFAVNKEYVSDQHILHDGDELAVFTAVSGG